MLKFSARTNLFGFHWFSSIAIFGYNFLIVSVVDEKTRKKYFLFWTTESNKINIETVNTYLMINQIFGLTKYLIC